MCRKSTAERTQRAQPGQSERQGKRFVACKPTIRATVAAVARRAPRPVIQRLPRRAQASAHTTAKVNRNARLAASASIDSVPMTASMAANASDCPAVGVIERSRQLPVRSDLVRETRGGAQRRVDCRTARERRIGRHGHPSGRTERLPSGDGQCDFLVFNDLIGPDQHGRAKRHDDVDDRDDHDRRQNGAGERLIRRGDVSPRHVAVGAPRRSALVRRRHGSLHPGPHARTLSDARGVRPIGGNDSQRTRTGTLGSESVRTAMDRMVVGTLPRHVLREEG